MSILNELKELVKSTPNDQDLGAKLRDFTNRQKTCCDEPKNQIPFEDHDSHPYGAWVKGNKCKVCGKIIDFKIER